VDDGIITDPFSLIKPTSFRDGRRPENINVEPPSGTKSMGDPADPQIDDEV
jgi:hypothetical protein